MPFWPPGGRQGRARGGLRDAKRHLFFLSSTDPSRQPKNNTAASHTTQLDKKTHSCPTTKTFGNSVGARISKALLTQGAARPLSVKFVKCAAQGKARALYTLTAQFNADPDVVANLVANPAVCALLFWRAGWGGVALKRTFFACVAPVPFFTAALAERHHHRLPPLKNTHIKQQKNQLLLSAKNAPTGAKLVSVKGESGTGSLSRLLQTSRRAESRCKH